MSTIDISAGTDLTTVICISSARSGTNLLRNWFEQQSDFLGVESLPLDRGQLVSSSKRDFKYPSALIDELGQQQKNL